MPRSKKVKRPRQKRPRRKQRRSLALTNSNRPSIFGVGPGKNTHSHKTTSHKTASAKVSKSVSEPASKSIATSAAPASKSSSAREGYIYGIDGVKRTFPVKLTWR